MTTLLSLHRTSLFLAALLGILATGCRTIEPDAAKAFGAAAGNARSQSQIVFAAINDLTQENILHFAAKQTALDESHFFLVIPKAREDQWRHAFSLMESYGHQLGRLAAFAPGEEFRESLIGLGDQLTKTTDLEVPPGLMVGFVKLGEKVLQFKARHDAMKLAVQADPEIQNIIDLMAKAMGDHGDEKLRGTVKANFNQSILLPIDEAFKFDAKTPEDKLRIATQYGQQLKVRESFDRQLSDLRRTLLNLGYAHAALAQGAPADVRGYVDTIQNDLADAKQLFNQLNTEASHE